MREVDTTDVVFTVAVAAIAVGFLLVMFWMVAIYAPSRHDFNVCVDEQIPVLIRDGGYDAKEARILARWYCDDS